MNSEIAVCYNLEIIDFAMLNSLEFIENHANS